MSFLGNEEQVRELQERFRYLYIALVLGVLILGARLAYLQIINGEQMRQYAEENRIKKVKIMAPRGMILDREHHTLVDNRPAFDVQITPQYLKESGHPHEVIERLAKLLKVSVDEIDLKLDKASFQPTFMPVTIKEGLTRDEVAELETWKLDLPGVDVQMAIQRTNLYGDIASHMIGYIGLINPDELAKVNQTAQRKYVLDDNIGKSGLEKEYEDILRGVDGSELVEVDALGRGIEKAGKTGRVLTQNREVPPVPGRNLVLTIDQDLQEAAIRGFGAKNGGIIALDPRNGEVLAMISRPSFDPTQFSRGISAELWQKLLADENKPLRDKTIQDHYSPGSTFKLVTAIAALEEGLIDENTIINCPGHITVGNRVVHCSKKEGHGNLNIVTAITKSCDVFFYRLAQKFKSVNDIAKWAFKLGFGSKTGIELAHEVPGLIPTEEWKLRRFGAPWGPGETLSVAIGQSFVNVTTIQLANAYASMINGGTLYRPHLVKSIESADGQVFKDFAAQTLGSVHIKKKTLDLITEGMWGVVNSPGGTAFSQHIRGMEFAGKTGTAQVMSFRADKIYGKCINLPYKQRHNGVFVGYAPIKDPSIVVAVITEHTCAGASGSGPVAREVIKTYLQKYYPDIYSPQAIQERMESDKHAQRPTQKGIEGADE